MRETTCFTGFRPIEKRQSYHWFTLLPFCWWYSPIPNSQATSPSQSHHLRFHEGWNFESEPFWHVVFHGPCLHDTILWTKRILGTFEFVAGMERDSRRFKVGKVGKVCRGEKFWRWGNKMERYMCATCKRCNCAFYIYISMWRPSIFAEV